MIFMSFESQYATFY